jgi:peptidoglycan L-alanyl-D-glutamate endopeptidase CwlK
MTVQQFQKLIGTKPDGDFGNLSLKAALVWADRLQAMLKGVKTKLSPAEAMALEDFILKEETPPAVPATPPDTGGKLHDRTEKNLKTLSDKTQVLARRFIKEINAQTPAGVEFRIIDGSRTWAEQDALYAQGRSKPGDVVTNARGGQSLHNFGIAFDVGVFINGVYQGESAWYDKAGPIGEKVGLEWGGRWKSPVDKPHYQLKTGLSLAQLRQRHGQGLPIG